MTVYCCYYKISALITTSYTYKTNKTDSSYTTGQVASFANNEGTLNYKYDNNGNIKYIKNNSGVVQNAYTYDELGQLVSAADRATAKWYDYSYDKNGNIQETDEYNCDVTITDPTVDNQLIPIGSTPVKRTVYEYGDSNWKDQMTGYTVINSSGTVIGSNSVAYDNIGNPTTYSGGTMEWKYGRTLSRYNGTMYDTTYDYNSDGMMISQAANYKSISYPYNFTNEYDGTALIRRTGPGYEAWFEYDEAGSPILMNLKVGGTTSQYYYVKNLQGDVVALTDSTGAIFCRYTYDTWGKLKSVKNANGTSISNMSFTNAANANPFRYRSYFLDEFSGFYYLQTRFYDPSTGRFINADGYVSTGNGVLGSNMFAYCHNNPIIFIDISGTIETVLGYGIESVLGMSFMEYITKSSTEENNNPPEKFNPYEEIGCLPKDDLSLVETRTRTKTISSEEAAKIQHQISKRTFGYTTMVNLPSKALITLLGGAEGLALVAIAYDVCSIGKDYYDSGNGIYIASGTYTTVAASYVSPKNGLTYMVCKTTSNMYSDLNSGWQIYNYVGSTNWEEALALKTGANFTY